MLSVVVASPDLRVTIHPRAVQIDPRLQRIVDTAWDQKRAAQKEQIFDGTLITVETVRKNEIVGHLTTFRFLSAQRAVPSLRAQLKIRPLGVSGVLICADGYVFGRRSNSVAMDQGMWELVPSGTVSAVATEGGRVADARVQFRTELHEEVGISESQLTEGPTPFVVVSDDVSGTVDVGVLARTNLAASAIDAAFDNCRGEYSAIRVVPAGDMDAFLEENRSTCVQVSIALLEALAALPAKD